jgi:2-C-methyl-D-erythritol 2,4-cyclodiphosphate synthase
MRIGFGYDIHRLEEGRPLIIGGVNVQHTKGLVGHSDADVLTHAIIDALLGAMARGDIGMHFPDTDARYAGADSITLLQRVMTLVRAGGYTVGNVDTVVVAEEPKLQPYIEGIRQRLAEGMDIEKSRISVKAKTNEKVGPQGCGEAISAYAVVLLETAD